MKAQRAAAVSPAFLPTTLSVLDEALHGGVACGSLTEVAEPLSKPFFHSITFRARGKSLVKKAYYFMEINLN